MVFWGNKNGWYKVGIDAENKNSNGAAAWNAVDGELRHRHEVPEAAEGVSGPLDSPRAEQQQITAAGEPAAANDNGQTVEKESPTPAEDSPASKKRHRYSSQTKRGWETFVAGPLTHGPLWP